MKEINRIHTPYRGGSPYIFISYSHKDFKNGKSRRCRQIFMYGRKMVKEHPEMAASEAGIVQRIIMFRKNGLPKPKREEDFEQEYRKY